ncbi:MAG: hypothetical protein IT436_08710 [Phycisphaerales bacterium]|nr:hypothetical protein [Phycisphaerales bacterium]
MRIRRRTIAWTSCAVFIAAFVVIHNLPLRYLPYSKWTEIDIHSGRQRELRLVFGMTVSSLPKRTAFGAFAEQHLNPLGPPVWKSTHFSSPFNGTRINFRFGGFPSELMGLMTMFEIWEIPNEGCIALADAALKSLSIGEEFDLIKDPEGCYTLKNESGRVLLEWDSASE